MNCKVCGNTSAKNPSVSFFRFPKESVKCREWAVRCDLLASYERHGTLRFYKSFRVCSDHFDPKDIVFDGRKKKLLQYARPQISVNCKNVEDEKPENEKKLDDSEIFKSKLLENICRLCAEEDRNLTDIYGFKGRILNLESKLKHLPLVISKYDILPLRVCNQCMSKLNQFHDFILNCIKAEAKLRIMFDPEDCNVSCKITKPNAECQGKVNWDLGTKQSLNESLDLDLPVKVQKAPDLMMCFSGNVEDDYYVQALQDNFIHENDNFFKQSEPNFEKTNQSTDHTNFIKEINFSRNVSFEHDYSNMLTRDQLQFETKNQTENNQNFVEETKHPCDICFQSSHESNAQSSKNAVQPNLTRELFCESYSEIFFSSFESDKQTSQHFKGSYTCKICDKEFHKVAFLKKHYLSHHFENSDNCFNNLRSSQIYPNANENILKRDQNKPNLFCELNPITSKLSKINFKFQKRRCQFCDRFFKNRQHCLAHEKTHTGETPYQCKQCGKGFRSRPSLRQHRSVHSDKRLYNCQECGMSFKRKDTLSNHLRIHTGERPFVCKVCGFAFKQRGDCTKHEKNHAKTFEVETKEENCGRTAIVGSATTDFNFDASQTSNGISFNEENRSSLPSFIPKPEEITPVDALEDIISSRLIPFNFLM